MFKMHCIFRIRFDVLCQRRVAITACLEVAKYDRGTHKIQKNKQKICVRLCLADQEGIEKAQQMKAVAMNQLMTLKVSIHSYVFV